ncbi:MAG: hypothetical protein AAGD32_14260 [Planctomycetota bacterium]
MPILDVELVCPPGLLLDDQLATRIADRAGAVFRAPAGRVWVKVRTLSRSHYAENGDVLPADVLPVFVEVLLADVPEECERAGQAVEIANAVAEACGRSAEHVHVLYAEPARGRIAFGGKLMT